MIICIDGPAGTGKSTVALLVAKNLNFQIMNTGLFYRALTYQVQDIYKIKADELKNIDTKKIYTLAKESIYEEKEGIFLVNGENIFPYLRTAKIENSISYIACIPEIRNILNKKMRKIAENKNIVCEGRDTSTVVFPHAQIKIYLDASLRVRALRRFDEQCSNLSLQEIVKTIGKRDKQDKERSPGALLRTKDATYIDSSDLTLTEVYEKVIDRVYNHLNLTGEYG